MIPAFGRGERMGADKLWADVGGRPLLQITLGAVADARLFDAVVVVAPRPRWLDLVAAASRAGITGVQMVEGGETRQDSVRHGLALCDGLDVVCIHDAARPLCPPSLFNDVVASAREHGAATAAIPHVDTTKHVEGGVVLDTPDRRSLMAAQTPQGFATSVIVAAHERAGLEAFQADDDCTLVERTGHPVHIVEGDPLNFKVTRPIDMTLLLALLAEPR